MVESEGYKRLLENNVAFFISPHGFGHAARAAAVIDGLDRIKPLVRAQVFTLVPRWFFRESLTAPFTYHRLLNDIGLAQKTSLVEDIPETLRRLNKFVPFSPLLISGLARRIQKLKCTMVICDIAPLGIAVA